MATLSGNKIKNTYQSLVKFSDNGNITVGAKQLTDGFGNNSPMFVSTTQVGIGVTPESGLNLHVFGDAKIGSNLTVIGNLVVEGSTTTVGTDTLTVKDPLIVLANNNTSTDAVDIGFYGKYTPSGTTLYSGLFREALTGKYRLFKGLEDEPTTTVNTSGTGYARADLVIGDLEATQVDLGDNDKIRLGDSQDLEIYHDGTNASFISNTNTTLPLQIFTDDLDIKSYSLQNNMIIANSGGAVQLYYGGSLKLSTSSTGIQVLGDLTATNGVHLADNVKASFGGSDDLEIYHDSFDNYIDSKSNGLFLKSTNSIRLYHNTEPMINAIANGTVSLYYDGSQKLYTTSTGISVTGRISQLTDPSAAQDAATKNYVDTQIGANNELSEVLANGNTTGGTNISVSAGDDIDFTDTSEARFGSDQDLIIKHTGTTGSITNFVGNLNIVNNANDSDIRFFTDDGVGGITTYFQIDGDVQRNIFYKDTKHSDSVVAYFGNGDDLEIYHNGSHAYLTNDTGNFEITTTGNLILQNASSNKWMMTNQGGGVLLYYNGGTSKLTTTPTGISINGRISGLTDPTLAQDAATKAYVDLQVGNNNELSEVLANGNTTGGNDIVVSANDDITFTDTSKAIFGASADLQIYHDGTHAVINGTTGNTYLSSASSLFLRTNGTETAIKASQDSSVELYYDNSKKLETTNTGISVLGTSSTFAGNIITTEGILDLNIGNTNIGIEVKSTDDGSYIRFDDGDNANRWYVGVSSGDFGVYNNANARPFKIDSSGNATFGGDVGIGTDSPSQDLEILNGTTGAGIRLAATNTAYWDIERDSTSGHLTFTDDGAGTVLTVGQDGNVGIGTDSPVAISAGAPSLTLNGTNTSVGAGLIFQVNGTTKSYQYVEANILRHQAVAGVSQSFWTDGSEKMRIDSSGNVGIGTTSPVSKLTLQGARNTNTITLRTTDNDSGWTVGDEFGAIEFYSNDTSGGSVGVMSAISCFTGTTSGSTSELSFSTSEFGSRNIERMRITSGGNIGIGTDSPSAKLDINSGTANSALRVLSTDRYTGIKFEDATNNDTLFYDGQSDLMYLSSTNFRAVDIYATGNVGIGTTTPVGKLEVSSSGANGILISKDTNTTSNSGRLFFETDTVSEGFSFLNSNGLMTIRSQAQAGATSGNVRVAIEGSGNVGIGTTSPTAKLQVYDDRDITSNPTNKGIRLQESTGDWLLSLGISSVTNTGFAIRDNVTSAYPFVIRETTGYVGIGTTSPSHKLDVESTTTPLHLNRTGGATALIGLDIAGVNRGLIGATTTAAFVSYSTAAASLMTILNSGNVGIGTTTPQSTLHVDGDIRRELDGTSTIGFGSGSTSAWYSGIKTVDFGAQNVGLTLFTTTNAGTTNVDALTIDEDGNVGIGTTSPDAKLDVNGNILISDTSNDKYFGSNVNLILNADADGNSGSSARNIIFQNRSSEKMRIDSSGNVGIGTSLPTTALQVSTAMTSSPSSNIFLDVDGSNINGGGGSIIFGTSASAGSATSYNAKITGTRASGGNGGDSTLGFWTTLVSDSTSSPQERMTISKEGNVGIGDTGPNVKLQVSTSSPTNNVAALIGDGWVGNSSYHKEGGLLLISGTSQDATQTGAGIAFQTRNTGNTNYWKSSMIMGRDGAIRFTLGGAGTVAGSEDFTILSGGNVGIGTTSPGQKLDVSGNIASNSIYLYDSTSNDRLVLDLDASDNLQIATGTSTGSRGITFFTENSEKMRILSGGNVGIGTTSPAGILGIARPSNVAYDGTNDSGQDTIGASVTITNTNTTVNSFAQINMQVSASSNRAVGRIVTIARGNASSDMAFVTESFGVRAEKMRIDQTGNVGIGTTTPTYGKITVTESGSAYTGDYIYGGTNGSYGALRCTLSASNSPSFIDFFRSSYSTTVPVGAIVTSGSNCLYQSYSDYRMKENVSELTGALDKVNNIQPKTFNYKEDTETTYQGFIAHELQEVVPQAVSGKKDEVNEDGTPKYQGVDNSHIVPLLVGAIQELKAEIELLKTQINN